METSKSNALFNAAKILIPGGVNSPVRACGSVGGQPVFIEKGDKSRLYDVDGLVIVRPVRDLKLLAQYELMMPSAFLGMEDLRFVITN